MCCCVSAEPWCTLEIWNLKRGRHQLKWRAESTACTGTHTQIHTMQHKTGVSSLQIHIVLFSFIFHCLKKKKKIVSFMSRHSCTNLTVKLPLWRFSPFRPLASVLTGNLREHHGYKVMWSFLLFLLHSYEKRLFWEEAKEAEKKQKTAVETCRRRILPTDRFMQTHYFWQSLFIHTSFNTRTTNFSYKINL